ncbi:MAG: NAD(P)-binding domain-containing protein [Alphaproteobacteria bacterium]|nr:NAD(P)-binding domain-containing protein [Alphaproteobacteria bacterium]
MHIAVIGAGPVGIEAAIAAQDLGHTVTVYEAGDVPAAHIDRWRHVTLFTPWSMNTSARGRARLGDPALLSSDVCPTGGQLRAHYLLPLAAGLDVKTGHRVREIGRAGLGKGQKLGSTDRNQTPFRLLLQTDRGELQAHADAVFDCSGTFSDPAPAGAGGLSVPGEAEAAAAGRLRYGPVRVVDLEGRPVLLIGDGASAVTVLRDLLALSPPARVTWLTPGGDVPGFYSGPDDVLPERKALWDFARQAAARVDHRPGLFVERLETREGGLRATLSDGKAVDAYVACVSTGFRPDNRMLRELQFHACWGTEGPMKLAAALIAESGMGGGDCLAAGGVGADSLKSPEPRLFVLGAKSYGRRSDFLLQSGLKQVDDALSLLA